MIIKILGLVMIIINKMWIFRILENGRLYGNFVFGKTQLNISPCTRRKSWYIIYKINNNINLRSHLNVRLLFKTIFNHFQGHLNSRRLHPKFYPWSIKHYCIMVRSLFTNGSSFGSNNNNTRHSGRPTRSENNIVV